MKAHPHLLSLFVAALIVGGIVALIVLHDAQIPLLAAYLIGINLATLLLYKYDKHISPAEGAIRRIPERVLLLLALIGGTVGAFLGIYLVRHKTDHLGFQLWFWLIVVVQVTLVFCLVLDTEGVCQDAWDCLLDSLP